tara:strand:- start:51 stop:470 length:420 start_codon:yes stop_codon:yes gene_type:complete
MQFLPKKRRATPSVIIVSLVDVLMVVLIFLVVSTTFKEAQAYIQMAASNNPDGVQNTNTRPLVISIQRNATNVLVDKQEFTTTELATEIKKRLAQTPNLIVNIEADGKVDWEKIVEIRDIAASTGVKNLNAYVEEKQEP